MQSDLDVFISPEYAVCCSLQPSCSAPTRKTMKAFSKLNPPAFSKRILGSTEGTLIDCD